ncbi:MAG: MFS transporter [Promethearchaeota archaeon]
MAVKIEEKPNFEKKSVGKMISFGMADLELDTLSFVVGQFLLLFYETEIGLNIWYVTFGYVIYAIWNAVNDPLIGFITDVPRKYWKKWGKRFPLIIGASIPFIFTIYLVYAPPNWNPETQPWFYVLWFIFSTCLFDTFFSIIFTSHFAQFPDLFRSDSDRRKSGGIRMALSLIGTTIGAVVPGMLITYYDRASYAKMALIFVGIGFVLFLTYIPGHIESKEMKMSYKEVVEKGEKLSMVKIFKLMLKQKNFMIAVLIFFLDSIIGASLSASIGYVVKYDLQKDAIWGSIVLAGFILGALGSIFIWVWYSQKIKNNRKMLIIGVFLNTIFLLPLIFFWDVYSLLVATFLLGIGGGALRVGRNPVIADVVDESVAISGKRFEGSMMGFYTFFNRLALIVQGVIFAVVHQLTGFDADSTTQTKTALIGIRIHTALIPMILCLLGLIFFIKIYDITPEKSKKIQEQIKEMGL